MCVYVLYTNYICTQLSPQDFSNQRGRVNGQYELSGIKKLTILIIKSILVGILIISTYLILKIRYYFILHNIIRHLRQIIHSVLLYT